MRVKYLAHEQRPRPGQKPGSLDSLIFQQAYLFCTRTYMIRPVAMMKRGSFVANMLQFFSKDVIDWYASESNMNFSLSLLTVGDLPNGFFLFILYFASKSLLLTKIPGQFLFCFTKADPIYIALINEVASFFRHLSFFQSRLNQTWYQWRFSDITFHLSNGIRF